MGIGAARGRSTMLWPLLLRPAFPSRLAMSRRVAPASAFALRSHPFRAPLAALSLLALAGCVDSSVPDPEASLVDPPLWNTRPGKMQTFKIGRASCRERV